jgi:hypothetical protein
MRVFFMKWKHWARHEAAAKTRVKSEIVSQAFANLAGYSAGAVIIVLLYYGFQLIYPYLQALYVLFCP